jgi:hypothetical protein
MYAGDGYLMFFGKASLPLVTLEQPVHAARRAALERSAMPTLAPHARNYSQDHLAQPSRAPTAAGSSLLDPASRHGQSTRTSSGGNQQQQEATSPPQQQRLKRTQSTQSAMIVPGLIRPPPKNPSCLNVLGNTTSLTQLPGSIKSMLLTACSIMGSQVAAEAALGLVHQPGLIPREAADILAAWANASAASASACRPDVSVLQALSEQPHDARKARMAQHLPALLIVHARRSCVATGARPSASCPRMPPQVLIAANFRSNAHVLPHLLLQLVTAAAIRPSGRVYISIMENLSSDTSPQLLQQLSQVLSALRIPATVVYNAPLERLPGEQRISYLARVRNAAMAPVHNATFRQAQSR